MQAMLLDKPGSRLRESHIPDPKPAQGQVVVRVKACAVCRTDLHIIDAELTGPKLPLILGHEIVGTVIELGRDAARFQIGERVGIPWLGKTCGRCDFCRTDRENLCDHALFTGYTLDGGYAEAVVADERFCFRIPDDYSDAEAAPLLCAGLIGYRSLRKAGDPRRVGLYGFGAAAHILTQVCRFQGREVYAFTRPGDAAGQRFAQGLGAVWTGGSNETPPELLDAALIFAPAGELVVQALKSLRKGGVVVCGGIHMSAIPSFPYEILWEERSLCSVANLTRRDGDEFFEIAGKARVQTHVESFRLNEANRALEALRTGKIRGAAVLIP